MDENDEAQQAKKEAEEFAASFISTSEGREGKPAEQPVDTKPDEQAPEGKPEETASPPPVADPPPAPEYVQITKEDYSVLRLAADETVQLKQQMAKAFGTIGNFKQQLEKLQSQTPAGQPVEMTVDDFEETKHDFPDLTEGQVKAFNRYLKRAGAVGTAAASAPKADSEDVQKAAREAQFRSELEVLENAHPDWQDIVGHSSDVTNEYRQWLATQPEAYQAKVNATDNPQIIRLSIDRQLAAKNAAAVAPPLKPKPPAPKPAAQPDRFRGAIQPKGDGGPPKAPRSERDDFSEGFARASA